MSEQTEGTSEYVIQRQDNEGVWLDVDRLQVPPRSRRSTLLKDYLGDAPVAGTYRVLDAESADPFQVSLEEQPPRLKIG